MYKHSFLLFIAFLFIQINNAQVPRFDHFDISKGLSQNYIYSLEIDDIGNIWLGTLDGLNKFNGYNFEIFMPNVTSNTHLVGNSVTGLKQSENGDLWITTSNGGLNKYNYKNRRFYHYPDSVLNTFSSLGYNKIAITNDSLIWIQKPNRLGVFNSKTLDFNQFKLSSKGIHALSKKSILCYGKNGAFVHTLEKGQLISEQIYEETIYELIVLDKYQIAVTNDGVLKFDSEFQHIDTLYAFSETEKQFKLDRITSLSIINNEIWVGSISGLFQLTDRNGSKTSGLTKRLLNRHISALKRDRAGNLWIGTASHGLFLMGMQKNQFHYTRWVHKSGLSLKVDPISAICKLKNGDLWLGFNWKGLGVIQKDGKTKYYPNYMNEKGKFRSMMFVRNIFEDSNNTIWIGTWNYICIYNPKKDRFEVVNHKLGLDMLQACWSIKEFEPGIVTIASGSVICKINIKNKTIERLTPQKKNIGTKVELRDMAYDKRDNMWAVHNNNGFLKMTFNPFSYKSYKKTNSNISGDNVYSLKVQGDSLWLASNSGLNLFDIKKDKYIKTFHESDGLSSNVIHTVHLDNNKNLWMSTKKGISKLNTNNNKISSYLPDDYFENTAYFYSQDGTIYYGSNNGVVHFNPKDIRFPNIKPTPIIEDFYLFNKRVNVGDTLNNNIILTNNISKQKQLYLTHEQHSFSLSFISYPFNYPNNCKFRYRLYPIEKEWIYPQNNSRHANYTTVKPGEYKFQVSVSSARNEWEPPSEITINIQAPFWQKAWFKMALVFVIIFTLILVVKLRTAQIKRRNIILRQHVEKQTKKLKKQTLRLKEQNKKIKSISKQLHEADKEKLKIFTNISHDFRTPITLILGHLENLIIKRDKNSASIIKNNANRLLEMVNQLIEVRKLDQNKLNLNINQFDLVLLTSDIINSFQVLAEQKQIVLNFRTEESEVLVWLDSDKIEKILFNLISNAIKYTPDGQSILVEIKQLQNEIILLIEDKGVGIDPKDIDKVFDRFFRSKKTKTTGHGIGLALTKGLVTLQHGTIDVKSELNYGTSFIVRFKNGKEHFNKEDFGASTLSQGIAAEPIEKPSKTFNIILGYKILLVEDNVELADYIINILEPHFEVKWGCNGKEALKIMEKYSPDIIVSDIMMPVMDGIEFCTKLKSNHNTNHIPIILLTAKTDIKTKIKGFNKGIDDYMQKPFNADLLITRINNILSNREVIKKYILSFGHVEMIKKNSVSAEDKEFLKKTSEIISQHYFDSDFNADKLSKLMFMGRTTFYRRYKSLSGINAADHLKRYRLHKAAELLIETDKDIMQTCFNVGYKSLNRFRENFKREFGKNPNEYRTSKKL